MSRKVGGAIWAFVALSRGRFWSVLAVSWQTHLTCRGARVWLWGQRPWKRKGTVARIVARIWCDELMMMLVVLLGMLGRTFPTCVTSGSRIAFGGRAAGRVWRVAIAEAGQADWARLHVVAGDVCMVGDDERLGDLVGL